MPPLNYIGLLGNVDKSILQVEFGNGFRIEEWPRSKFEKLCQECIITEDVSFKLDDEWGYNHVRQSRRHHVYVILKEHINYPERYKKNLDGYNAEMFRSQLIFERTESDFLDDKITKLRLCAEGSVNLCVESFYIQDQGEIEPQSSTEEGLYCENRLFKIRKSELEKVNNFLKTPRLKPNHAYVHFALENFSQSYRVAHIELEFITLMIGLETLFNDGKQELRYKISRNCAVLLGRTKSESEKIYEDLKKLYDKRSVLVHTGDKSTVNETNTLLLKEYLRKSLFRVIKLNLSKENLVKKLTETGFGSGKSI